MLFFVTPQAAPQYVYNPEESLFSDYKRRQYIAALEEQEQRAQFEHELALEEQRHRIALQSIARKEAARRQQQEDARFAHYAAQQQQRQRQQPRYSPFCGYNSHCQPSPEQILKRRQARQQEEERRSREFHERILSQIFGAPVGREQEPSTRPAEKEKAPVETAPIDRKGKGKAEESTTSKRPREEEQEPHWSAAPERARALAEITSIHRAFTSLKNTFVFPSGALERLPDSDIPRLAFNSTNASIHAYEHALSELLTKLDGVESHGFKGVREARKQLVVKIEKELEELERRIAERLAEAASPAKGSVAIPSEPSVPAAAAADVIVPIEGPSDDEEDVEIKEAATSSATAIRVEEKQQQVEAQQPSALATESAAPSTLGYDVELDQEQPEVQPTPAVDDASKTTTTTVQEEEDTGVEEAHPMEVEVPSVDAPTVDQAVAPTAPVDVALPQTEDDEESEIEDAIRIDISSEEEEDNAAADHRHEAEHLDGGFEML
ncbi:hypothetical protein FRC17_003027 [Serendipita sp. 399]|nr:hypothetical protein FRC17_003027 [Serendipita sp. 399]